MKEHWRELVAVGLLILGVVVTAITERAF